MKVPPRGTMARDYAELIVRSRQLARAVREVYEPPILRLLDWLEKRLTR